MAALTPWLRVGAPRAYGGPKSSRSIAFDVFRAALEETYPGKAKAVEVIDFFGRDEALAHLCYACADMLTTCTRANSHRLADLTQLFASYLVEKYTNAAAQKPEFRGGLPIRQLRK